MATLDHISGAEPSTVTFKVRTARYNQNSSNMHAEILVIGDPETTNALAAVLAAAPASTAWGVVVRPVGTLPTSGDSTVLQGTNPWVVNQQSTVWAVQLTQYSTTANISSLAGAVIVRSSAANALVSVYQSTAADLNATVSPAAGSTWRTQPGSTAWASSAGFHFDSSGGLQVNAGTLTASTQVTVSQLLDSSGGSVTAADSANNAIRVNVVAGAAGGSTIVTVSSPTVTEDVASGANKGFLSFIIREDTPSAGAVTNLDEDYISQRGSKYGALYTTALDSSGGLVDQRSVAQASTTWAVQLTQYSTIVAVSSLGGAVIVRSSAADFGATVTPVAGSTWATRPIQSSAADLQVTATQSAAVWTVNVGSHIQSTAAPSSNSSGIVVRQVVDNLLTTASTSAFASTAMTIQSSGAGLRSYVTAYSITTTNAGPSKIAFYSSGVVLWPILLAAVSSAVSGVNLAVAPPGYLFRTIGAADGLTLNLGGGASTIGGWRVGVSYFRAP